MVKLDSEEGDAEEIEFLMGRSVEKYQSVLSSFSFYIYFSHI